MLGGVGVFLASLLERKRAAADKATLAGKKFGFRVTSSEVAQAYHLLHQISMTGEDIYIHSGVTTDALSSAPQLLVVWAII